MSYQRKENPAVVTRRVVGEISGWLARALGRARPTPRPVMDVSLMPSLHHGSTSAYTGVRKLTHGEASIGGGMV